MDCELTGRSFVKPRSGCPFALHALLSAAVCPFLSINDLFACSSLCHEHHAVFDSESVWKPRLDRLLRLQLLRTHDDADINFAIDQPEHPQPPLADVVRMLDEARDQQETLHGVVRIRGSSTYHTRVTIDGDWDLSGWLVLYSNIVTLHYNQPSQQWRIEHTERNVGWAANNTHNVLEGQLVDEPHPTDADSSTSSSKQRYIRRQTCSEHEHSLCHHLLPPASPLPPPLWPPRDIYTSLTKPNAHLLPTKQPSLLPLPLCSSCQPRLLRPVQAVMDRWFGPCRPNMRVSCLVRVNACEVDVTVEEDDCLSRRCILQRAVNSQYSARMVASRLELYSISHPSNVPPFIDAPAPPLAESEVQCAAHTLLCDCGLTQRTCPPSTPSYKSATNAACRQCGVGCPDDQPMSWCRRCWYTLCNTCTRAELQKQQSVARRNEAATDAMSD